MTELLSDFPKLYCPFIRQTFKINSEEFKKKRAQYKLRRPEVYLVVNCINPGYEWVFDDKDTIAVEKLDGMNVKIKTKKGRIEAVQNRKNIIDPLQVVKGQPHIMEGIFTAGKNGYVKEEDEQAGELIGPKVQGNPYKLNTHEWFSFDRAISGLQYKSFHEHDRTFDNLSMWFKDWLFSRFYTKRASKAGKDDKIFAEGIVFYNLRRKNESKIWRAKLRRDMFIWYYEGIEVYDYDKKGRDTYEDQGIFD
ncbi:MAG: hypothetical protein ABH869_07260 [Candidatus Omnitrophota bacterium]